MILVGPARIKAIIKALEESDVIIDIWGIVFADQFVSNTFRCGMSQGFRYVLGKILGKPIIKYTADFGPFNNKWNRRFARLYIEHSIDLVLARDETSRQFVEALGVKTPIIVVPDTAFLLLSYESEESKRYATLRKERPLVGLSVSYQTRNRATDSITYVAIMADFVSYLIAKYRAHVVIIPNELSKGADDDCKIAEEICAKLNSDRCDVLHTDNLLAQEIKGVINQCEAIVASRYHTIVASLSLGIPTLAIGWHHKYAGVLKLFKQEQRVCNIEELRFENLVENFDDLWNNREEVRKTIISFLPGVKERVRTGAKQVYDIVSAKSR